MNAYDNTANTTTFADDNIHVFKYITPTITILPYKSLLELLGIETTNSLNGNN